MAMTDRVENRMVKDELWNEPKRILQCDDCGGGIYQEEYYYNIVGDIICEDCINDYIKLNFRRNA